MHIYFSIFKLLDRLAYRGIHYSLSRNGSLQWQSAVFINSGQVMGAHPWKARSGGPIQQTSECSSVCQRTISTWAGPMSNGRKSKEPHFVGTFGSSTLCLPWPGITLLLGIPLIKFAILSSRLKEVRGVDLAFRFPRSQYHGLTV